MNPHSHTFKLVFGILGNIIGVGVNLAPVKTFWYICKKRDSQGFSGLPYVFSLVAALIWVLYGLPNVTPNALPIITINVAGSAVQSCYIIIFLSFASKKPKPVAQKYAFAKALANSYGKEFLPVNIFSYMRQLLKVIGACFVLLAILVLVTLKVVRRDYRSLTVGSICVVIGVVTYASPLSVAKAVVQTRCVKFLPIVLCVSLFINSTVWTCYGIITSDKFVLIPNGVGVIFGVAQISLYAWYRDAMPLDKLPVKGKNRDAHVKGQNGDAHEGKIDDKSFDKLGEKSVKGELPRTALSQGGNNEDFLANSFISHASPGAVVPEEQADHV